MKKLGARAGYPDIVLNVPRQGYHALFIEMKTAVGVVGPKQEQWIRDLTDAGNCVRVCRSWIEARETLEWYLAT